MKFLFRFISSALLLAVLPAQALTLHEAAELALQNDPRMHASAAEVAASGAQIEQARAGYLPNLSALADAGRSNFRINSPFPPSGQRNPADLGVELSQPLYAGGALDAAADYASSSLSASKESQRDSGGRIILAAVTAYLDVLRDRGVVQLSQTSLETLNKARSDTQKRFDAGESTRTDVAQADARLAEGQANLRRAQAQLRISEAAFERVTGTLPRDLTSDWPAVQVPATLDEARKLSASAPPVLQAQATAAASKSQIELASAEHMPRVSLDGQADRSTDGQFGPYTLDTWQVLLKVKLPIYEGGLTRARVAEADARAQEAQAQAEDVRRRFAESATREWESLQAAQEVTRAYESQVAASESALDGVRKELDAGTRTTLDLLNAERELLSSQVNLLSSRRDRAVDAFELLAVCGILFPEAVP